MGRRRVPLRALHDAYAKQRCLAAHRGIGWEFTFDTWHRVWIDSGMLAQRGAAPTQFCMARHGDVGPYAPGNVSVKTNLENMSEAFDSKPFIDRNGVIGTHEKSLAGGRGYSFDKSHPMTPWRALFRNKNIGRFSTEQQARAAYVKAATEYLTSQGKPIPASLA